MDNRKHSDIITQTTPAVQAGKLANQFDELGMDKSRELSQSLPLQIMAPPTYQVQKRPLHFVTRAINQLWVRLSLAFIAIAIISSISIILLITFGTFGENDPGYNLIDFLERPNGPVDQLTDLYNKRQSWDGAEEFLKGLQSTYPIARLYSVSFSLSDANNEPVVSFHPDLQDREVPVTLSRSLTIWVDGMVVGRLRVIQTGSPTAETPQTIFLEWLQQWWWLIGLVSVISGLTFGLLFSRSLATPFSQLAQTARKIGARDWGTRIDVHGTSEIMDLAQALNRMAQDLEHGEILRRNMVADVAHELRTPLTVLQGSLRALIDGVYPLETKEIANLYDQTLVLRRLVTDLHELSLAESRAIVLNRQPINIAEFISRIISSFEPVAEERQVQINIEIPSNLPILRVDPPRIAQVLNNVLDNALRHTPAGEGVTIKVFRSQDDLSIAISDTGQGIAPEHLPYIFERFYRADRARTRQTGGSGLGLAIARAIVHAHDGKILAESEGLGKGTTICITFPVPNRPIIPHSLGS